MKHVDEGTLLALRDGEHVSDEARLHLEECATCRSALAAAHARADEVEHTLTALDRPIEPTAAKAGVRARLRPAGHDGPQPVSSRWSGRHLGRAAGLLLVTAGAAAALPGSPLRSLWVPSEAVEAPPATADQDAAPVSERGESGASFSTEDGVGIAVAVIDSSVYVVVRGAHPGTVLSVAWTDQSSARVIAPAGSRFTYAAGRIEVDASRGAISIELPRNAGEVSVEVDGQLYLQGSSAVLQVFGPLVERTRDTIRFRVDEP